MNLGDDGSLITPYAYIVGNIRGKQIRVCGGNAQYPKECYSNAGVPGSFEVGDTIDFTWGMLRGQGKGVLIYAIVPSG